MPVRSTAPVGAPCWVDLMSSDSAGARTFYPQLLGWEAEEPAPEFGGYFNFNRNGVRVAGCMASQPDAEVRERWSIYLATDVAAKTFDAAISNGGSVALPVHPVADLGKMAFVVDPGGSVVGMWEPGSHPGFGLVAEHGAPSWFELTTGAYDRVVTFYRDVFHWDTQVLSDTPEFRYTTLVHGGEPLAGIHDAAGLPDAAPTGWSVYFGNDDTDASLETVVKLGGRVLRPAEDTPYGRMATVTDPAGATFKLVAPNAQMPAR